MPYGRSEISIVAPGSAEAGALVSLEVVIKNVADFTMYALPGFCSVNGKPLFSGTVAELIKTLEPGETASWYDRFIMAESDVLVHVESWWENTYVLHRDDTDEKTITIEVPSPEFFQIPSETLASKSGDCEDTSILLCSLLKNLPNAHVALGSFQGYGHAWCQLNGDILETTYTSARPVPDPQDYLTFLLFDEREVIELWPGALEEIFSLRRDESFKLNLMAGALEVA
ncbi:hypothetical protein ES703_98989 [subsurface metagenome]